MNPNKLVWTVVSAGYTGGFIATATFFLPNGHEKFVTSYGDTPEEAIATASLLLPYILKQAYDVYV